MYKFENSKQVLFSQEFPNGILNFLSLWGSKYVYLLNHFWQNVPGRDRHGTVAGILGIPNYKFQEAQIGLKSCIE